MPHGPTRPQSHQALAARTPLSAAQFCAIVIRAAPALWRRAQARHVGAADQRGDFKQALEWLAAQKGLAVRTGVAAHYRNAAQNVSGRVDLVVKCDDGVSLAIEIDNRPTRASAWKLLALSRTGALPLLLVGWGQDATIARARVDEWFNKPTRHWLRIAVLAPNEHGQAAAPVPPSAPPGSRP